MELWRRILMIGGTVGCALATGYFMQKGAERDYSSEPSTRTASLLPLESTLSQKIQVRSLKRITLTSVDANTEAPDTSIAKPATNAAPVNCRVTATAEPAPMASATLSIVAPCHKNEGLTVHHNGLMFSASTDAEGRLTVTIPVLSEKAIFIAEFANNKGSVASATIPDLKAYDRLALQWRGDAGFQLHALEFGATYGEDGHVWASENSQGLGNITRLGDAGLPVPQIVEIYSVPSDSANRTGNVEMSVEAEVTDINCGRPVNAQSFVLHGGDALRSRDLVISMPDCSSVGDFLVLNNLFQNLKIAAR